MSFVEQLGRPGVPVYAIARVGGALTARCAGIAVPEEAIG
jgi:hypothetical protein